jgi:hypothetical protein
MRIWTGFWSELREVAWLVSIVGGLSVLGVVLAVALALALETHAQTSPPGHHLSSADSAVNSAT